MAFRFDWRGDNVRRRSERASADGIDTIMAKAVRIAKTLTPRITGTAQGSLRFQPARKEGRRIVGRWGSHDVDYFIWLEIGARGRSGHHMLRQAADRTYPELPDEIRRRMAT